MPRKRMIDPRIWESEQAMALNSDGFKLYIYTISHADDEGRMQVSVPMLRCRCYPMQLDEISEEVVAGYLQQLCDCGLVALYGNGKKLLGHPNWKRYQSINKPQESKLPPIPEDYGSDTVVLPPNRIEENRRERNRKESIVGQKQPDVAPDPFDKPPEDKLEVLVDPEPRTFKQKPVQIPYRDIVDYLNQICGTGFKADAKATRSLIKARWNEGHRTQDFKAVIDSRRKTWGSDPKFCEFLRPSTLFGNKFESYLQKHEPAPPGAAKSGWKCSECGVLNNNSGIICLKCGKAGR